MELLPYRDADRWLSVRRARHRSARDRRARRSRADGGDPRLPSRRLDSVAAGLWWYTIVLEPGAPPIGTIGIFGSDIDGRPVSEAAWLILPAFQGRGYASAALGLLLERARDDGRWGAIHALPGITNGPSNGLCRKFGFRLVGEQDVDYGGRTLRCNHWVLEPATPPATG